MSTIKPLYGTQVALAVTALHSLASSASAGWKSALVDNITSTLAMDYEVGLKLVMANTAPSSTKTISVYVCPAWYDATNSVWVYSDAGTVTMPSTGDATYTIAAPNNLILAKVLNYTATNQVVQGMFNLSSLANVLGNSMPDGFLIILVNDSGAAIHSSGSIITVKPIQLQIV